MKTGDESWITLEASGWRNRALLAEKKLADFAAAEAVERDGWVLVPRVPTPEMYLAAVTAWQGALSDYWTQGMWDAMIAAAPASGGSHE